MKKLSFIVAMLLVGLTACQRELPSTSEVPQHVKDAVKRLGFTTQEMYEADGGYIVEGDIFLSKDDIQRELGGGLYQLGEEHYHTTNLVTGLPRVIKIYVDTKLPASYVPATDEMIARYNAENLQITFQRVTTSTGADITFVRGNGSYLASSGFPTSTGAPYNQVKVNSTAIGSTPNQSYLATILAHEVGHCIGFRHTDYMDRSYSCGGSPTNEGASTVGAILIPNTPSTAEPSSWMLACIGGGQNRPFDAYDKTALNYLY